MNLSEKSYASVLFFLLGYMASGEASLRAFLYRDCDKTSFMDFFGYKNTFIPKFHHENPGC